MRTTPIVAADVTVGADGTPRSPLFDDVYHPREGALAQARHVFLAGNGLPGRWRSRDRFVILEAGFGLGNNFLATWQAWRDDAARPMQLHVVSIEAHPPSRDTLASMPRDEALRPLADLLAARWPPLTFNLHRLRFDEGRVELLLAFGAIADWLPRLSLRVDAFYLDGFAPARNPLMWQPQVFKAMARIAADDATAATWSAARPVRDGLRAAGFAVEAAAGSGAKRDITVARFAPRHRARLMPRAAVAVPRDARIAVVGAGLAGCAVAGELAVQGLRCTVFEAADRCAAGASGNAAGVFHGVVHGHDGRHARWHRSAALAAKIAVDALVADRGAAVGQARGLLRLAGAGGESAADLAAAALALALPADYALALDAAAASGHAGVSLDAAAWLFPGGGWVDPAALARHALEQAGDPVVTRFGHRIAALRRGSGAWELIDATGLSLGGFDAVVCANGFDALALLGGPDWPLAPVRGQTTALEAGIRDDAFLPALPLAGAGYLVAGGANTLWVGATAQEDDLDLQPRAEDDEANRQRAAALWPGLRDTPVRVVGSRAGLRCRSADRLPVIGAVPDEAAVSARPEQPRFAPRRPGLFVCTALGSRGIASSALGGALLGAMIAGAPLPLENDLLDAVDPARFASRRARRPRRP